MPDYTINRRQLMIELSASAPLLKKEAEAVLRQQLFDPAVEKLKEEFQNHLITQELKAGMEGENESGTIIGDFNDPPKRKDKNDKREDYTPPNLFTFIGFEEGTDPTEAIEERLDPSHRDGPKVRYVSMDKERLVFTFEVKAPSEEAIYNSTPTPWAEGLSWAKRIEQGIPGVGYFLNALNKKRSHSGGGIQVPNKLRGGTFRPTKYLTQMFKNFLRRVSSGREPL